jgi:hypothetical protein
MLMEATGFASHVKEARSGNELVLPDLRLSAEKRLTFRTFL